MNINLLDLYLKELCSNSRLREIDFQYIISKDQELEMSQAFIKDYIISLGIKIQPVEVILKDVQTQESIFAEINKNERVLFSNFINEKKYTEIVHRFEKSYFDTNDTFLIEKYLFALKEEFPFERTQKQAKIYYGKFPDDKRIINVCYQIAIDKNHFAEALDLLIQLNKLGEQPQQKIDNLLFHVLENRMWNIFERYSYTNNYTEILSDYLLKLSKNEKYLEYVQLFNQCEINYNEIQYEQYIKALLNIGEYKKAKSVCKERIGALDTPILFAYMAIACENNKEYHDSAFYYEKAVSKGLNYRNNLENVKGIIREMELEAEQKAIRKAHEEKMRLIDEANLRKQKELEKQREQERKVHEDELRQIYEKEELRKRIESEKQREKERIDREKERELNRRDEKRKARQKEEEDRELKETVDEYQQEIDKLAEVESGNYGSGDIHTFSSAITRGGDIVNPDKIIIEADKITWKKRSKYLIGGESKTIPTDKISSVDLKVGVIGTDIIIRSYGSGIIHAENFTKSDAEKIKSLLGF